MLRKFADESEYYHSWLLHEELLAYPLLGSWVASQLLGVLEFFGLSTENSRLLAAAMWLLLHLITCLQDPAPAGELTGRGSDEPSF